MNNERMQDLGLTKVMRLRKNFQLQFALFVFLIF